MSARRRLSPGKGDRHGRGAGRIVAGGAPSYTSVAAIAPPPLKDGQARCGTCRNGASLTPSGGLRRHSDLFGHPCFNRAPEGAVLGLAELPPVLLPGGGTNHLPVTGACHECNRPVSGERRFCGPCLARRL